LSLRYATYAAIAGVSHEDPVAAKAGLPAPDSFNMWPLLSGQNATSPRTEVVIGDTSAEGANADGKTLVGGLIRGPYKLLVGAKDKDSVILQDVITVVLFLFL